MQISPSSMVKGRRWDNQRKTRRLFATISAGVALLLTCGPAETTADVATFAVAGSLPRCGAGAPRPLDRIRTARSAVVEGDEFRAAKERIRRIQLGLSDDEPLPEEEEFPGRQDDGLDLAEAAQTGTAPVDVNVTGSTNVTDPTAETNVTAPQDAFSGTIEGGGVPELEENPEMKKKDGPNILVALTDDLTRVTLPTTTEVIQTFGIVLLLVGLYTGFVAVVDYGAQQVLGQIFADFYKAARPEAPSL